MVGSLPVHAPRIVSKGFVWTDISREQAHVFHSKRTSWCVQLGLHEPTFATGRATCRGYLLDFGVFSDLEGAFPDLDNHLQNLKIALDLQFLLWWPRSHRNQC